MTECRATNIEDVIMNESNNLRVQSALGRPGGSRGASVGLVAEGIPHLRFSDQASNP